MLQETKIQATEFKSYDLMAGTKDTDHLTVREKHLIGLAVTATARCADCTGERIRNAVEQGVPYETVVAAIDMAAACNAGVTLRMAIEGSKAQSVSKQACEDGLCTIGAPTKAA